MKLLKYWAVITLFEIPAKLRFHVVQIRSILSFTVFKRSKTLYMAQANKAETAHLQTVFFS